MLPALAWRQAGFQHPQGKVVAPVGGEYVQLGLPGGFDRTWRKLYGGISAFGWCVDHHPNDPTLQSFVSTARFQNVLTTVQAIDGAVDNAAAVLNICLGSNRRWTTTANDGAAANSFAFLPILGLNSAPTIQRQESVDPTSNQCMDFDVLLSLRTTPRISNAQPATVLALSRIWFVIVLGQDVQNAAGIVDDQNLYGAYPGALVVGNCDRAFAIRHESAVDVGWIPITANDDAVVGSQTEGAPLRQPDGTSSVVANTDYDLRIRYAHVESTSVPTPACYFSVNGGVEVKIVGLTTGFSTNPGGTHQGPMRIYLSNTAQVATLKSLGFQSCRGVCGFGLNQYV